MARADGRGESDPGAGGAGAWSGARQARSEVGRERRGARPAASDRCGRERGSIAGAILDAALFVAALALFASLLHYVAVLPNARRAERLERRGYGLERDVAATAAEVERLRREVTALQTDPYTIERTYRRRLKELRPDRFGPDGAVLPPPVAPGKPGSTR